MDEIKKYLEQEKPEFNEGFRLLCKYCRNQSLLSYIGRTGSMKHLMYNLQKLSRNNVKPNPQAQSFEVRFNRTTPVQVVEKSSSDDETSPQDEDNGENEPSELELAEEIISHYKQRYRREDLPEHLQELWDKNTDQYKELRAYHEKMKQCNSDTGRAEFRELVVSLANAISDRYELIEEKMKDNTNNQAAVPASKLNSARAYISKMLKKDKLSDEQVLKVKEYYQMLVDAEAEIKEETLMKLRERGYVS